MRELLNIITESLASTALTPAMTLEEEGSASASTTASSTAERVDLAVEILAEIAQTPFRRVLVPYFTRILTFQCGIRARLVSSSLLATNFSHISTNGALDFNPILALLQQIRAITTGYCKILDRTLGAALTGDAMSALTVRIAATVDRCGVTQIANDLIDCILQQKTLRYELFAHFLGAGRFDETSVKLRKVLSYLFKTASRQEALKFQSLFEGSLMKMELSRLAFRPVVDARGVILASWAMDLVLSVAKLLETARSVAQLEFAGISQCSLSAERALRREFGELPSEAKRGFSSALAISLNTLLSGSYSEGGRSVHFNAIQRETTLESVVALQKVNHVMPCLCNNFVGPILTFLPTRIYCADCDGRGTVLLLPARTRIPLGRETAVWEPHWHPARAGAAERAAGHAGRRHDAAGRRQHRGSQRWLFAASDEEGGRG
jgi:hypothetical protein